MITGRRAERRVETVRKKEMSRQRDRCCGTPQGCLRRRVRRRPDGLILLMDLEHGCRSEYGPLELRIQTTSVDNSFIIYIEDTRLTQRPVHEHQALGTIESA